MKRMFRFALAAASLLCSTTYAHPDTREEGLLMHWAPDAHPIVDNRVEEVSHDLTAKVLGQPRTVVYGPSQGWRFDGAFERIVIADDFHSVLKHLPTKAFSVASWVRVEKPRAWGSIMSVFEDTGDREKGWVFGCDEQFFQFALATKGADDGNGRMTVLKGSTRIDPLRWYYVVATYDGTTMRLYVDGKLEAESHEQSGDILYPEEKNPLTIACYQDSNELLPLQSTIHRVKLYGRVLNDTEIKDAITKNQNMIDFKPDSASLPLFLVKPYLQFATKNSITVMSETEKESTMIVEYAKGQPLERSTKTEKPSQIAELTLTDLEPATTYYYRVRRVMTDGTELVSDIYSFRTAVEDDEPWAFGVIGDTQRNPEVTRKCAEGLYGLRPNMVIHCGDVVDDGFAKNQWIQDLFEPCQKLFAHVPLYPTIGNHENDSHFYYDYFSTPKPEYWYTFRYGNAQFFMIDSNRPTQPGSAQYKWLEAELSKSTALWKMTVHHHPCFSSDEDDYGDKLQGNPDQPGKPVDGDEKSRPLVPLYEKYGVDIAFAGHIHSYERTWPIFDLRVNLKKGVNYIVSGGGGGGLEKAAPNRSWFQKIVQSRHHYCYATVYGDTMEFSAYDADGELFDRCTITKRPDAAGDAGGR
jgi:acid phosphatase type 7